MYNPNDRVKNDEAFGGFIGVDEIYNGEAAKSVDLSKYDAIIKAMPKPKNSIPVPKKSIPTKKIKGSAGKGTSQLRKWVDSKDEPKIKRTTEEYEKKLGHSKEGARREAEGYWQRTDPKQASLLKSRLDNIIKQVELKSDPMSKKVEKDTLLSKKWPTKTSMNRQAAQSKRINRDFGKHDWEKEAKKSTTEKTEKGLLGTAAGGIIGGVTGGPMGAAAGMGAGHAVEDSLTSKKPMNKSKEGRKPLIGAGMGALAGGLATGGNPVGAGLGAMAGQAIGSSMKHPEPIKRPMARTGQRSDHLKSQAYLSVNKAIHLMKAMVDGEQLDSSSNPPEEWMQKCMAEVGDENQCKMIWSKQASQSQAPWQEENSDINPAMPGTQRPPEETEDDSAEYDNLGKWMGGALQGGTLSSLLGHPVAGAAIQTAGKEIGRKILGQEVDDAQAQQIGMAAFDAIEGIINESNDDSMKKAWPALAARIIPTLARGAKKAALPAAGAFAGEAAANKISQKAVVQQLDKKLVDEAIGERKPHSDFGGESQIVEGSKVNIKPLTEKSEAQDETGKAKKIDAKKIAHNYKIK